HIRDPESAIGTGLDHGRAEPVVTGGEELGLLFVHGPPALERRSLGRQYLAVDEIMHRFAHESAIRERWPKQVVAVDDDTARRGEAVGGKRIVEALYGSAYGVHPSRSRRDRNRHAQVWGCDV